jgi:hypothetical protein
MTIVIVVFPIGLIVFIKKYKEMIIYKDEFLNNRVGSMFSNLKLNSDEMVLNYNVVFMLRRLIFALTVVFFVGSPLLQV